MDKTVAGSVVKAPGFGAMGMSAFYGKSDDATSEKVLQHAIDIGCTFWDTADIYGPMHNEELIGKVLARGDNRKKVFLATKFGGSTIDEEKRINTWEICGKPEYVRSSLEKSIKRLGTTPDLYYQHRVDPNTPIEDTVREMDKLRKEGKFKYLGMSEASAETLRRAAQCVKVDVFQVEYSPWQVDIETNGILDVCKEFNITIVAYSPLGRGFLTGEIKSRDDLAEDDFRRMIPRFSPENFEKNLLLVRELESIAQKKNVKPSQLILAWIMKQGNFIPIPGCRSISRLDENWGSANVKVTDDEEKQIRAAINKCTVDGDRYPDFMLSGVEI